MSLDAFQAVIDASLNGATPLSQRIYANHAWSASMAQRFINRVMGATVATVRADGRPHAAVTLCCCVAGDVHIAVSDGSVLLRNLRRSPDVALTVSDHEHDLTAFGTVANAGQASQVPDLLRDLHRATRRGQFTPPGWDGWIYRVEMERVFISR